MRCTVPSVNSTLRTGPQGPLTIRTDRTNWNSTLRTARALNDPYGSNELSLPLADRYSAGVLDMTGGVLAKNYLLIVIPNRNIKAERLILPHINLSNFELVPNWRNQKKIWRVCIGCYQTLIPYISIGNCNSELIFGMRASLRILYKNMTSYPIISKK